MLWLGFSLILARMTAMALLLPLSQPVTSMVYGSLLRSLLHLWSEEPRLSRSILTQGLLFVAFSVFWTILALHL